MTYDMERGKADSLERIANALERIADALEGQDGEEEAGPRGGTSLEDLRMMTDASKKADGKRRG